MGAIPDAPGHLDSLGPSDFMLDVMRQGPSPRDAPQELAKAREAVKGRDAVAWEGTALRSSVVPGDREGEDRPSVEAAKRGRISPPHFAQPFAEGRIFVSSMDTPRPDF